jgi:hypothetical protein
MSSKLRLQYGALQIEFEGSDEFLKTELPVLLTHIAKLPQPAGSADAGDASDDAAASSGNKTNLGNLSTSTIAQKLNVGSGTDLIIAACAFLTIGKGQETFSRKEILTEMRSAKAYFKATYRNNLSGYLTGLTRDGRLNQIAEETYSLPSNMRTEIEKKIAN